ncbi:MAG TPA: LPS assembly lipoprotein LptE [Caulobacterales bacterium]|jgi:LPS-assembly lipoprotein|nr:LPS assembly lipoprotein LptE [Caulobacterales bacterium]
MRFAIVPALLAASVLGAPVLGACSFTPLYAPQASGAPAIGPVLVDEVPGRSGFAMKNALDKLFDAERGTGPARRLAVKLDEGISGLGFRLDESATRSDLTLAATYTLYDVDGTEVTEGRASAVASYDIPNSAYAEVAAQNDARDRAADMLAERIRAELAIKLSAKRKS